MPKPQQQREASPQSFERMADMERIARADYLSSPYYRAFIEARAQSDGYGGIPYYTRSGNSYRQRSSGTAKKRGTFAAVQGYRRRKGFIALTLIFMLVIIAIAVLGYIGGIVPEYISLFVKAEGSDLEQISIVDPVMGALKKFAGMETESVFYTEALENVENESNLATKIAYYALPVVIALSVIFALIILIMAFAALCKRGIDKGYVARKTKYGFLCLLLFLFSLFTVVCGIVWNGKGLTEITGFFMSQASYINAGYGLFGLVGCSLLGMIFNWCSYSKVKG